MALGKAQVALVSCSLVASLLWDTRLAARHRDLLAFCRGRDLVVMEPVAGQERVCARSCGAGTGQSLGRAGRYAVVAASGSVAFVDPRSCETRSVEISRGQPSVVSTTGVAMVVVAPEDDPAGILPVRVIKLNPLTAMVVQSNEEDPDVAEMLAGGPVEEVWDRGGTPKIKIRAVTVKGCIRGRVQELIRGKSRLTDNVGLLKALCRHRPKVVGATNGLFRFPGVKAPVHSISSYVVGVDGGVFYALDVEGSCEDGCRYSDVLVLRTSDGRSLLWDGAGLSSAESLKSVRLLPSVDAREILRSRVGRYTIVLDRMVFDFGGRPLSRLPSGTRAVVLLAE